MSIVSVQPKSFILALFIRDDNERFLLGDNGYDFKDSQLHFAANTIENDEVQKQGADGVMIAGQVRRASVQSFDGFVGDATMAKETIEQMRRDFIAFFLKGHHYRVIYVDCNRNAWQRKGGYLVDAPEVKELWQIHPEYHVGLNFEDVNYYSYDEDADGNEILANLVNVPVSTEIEGGLVWDEDGAVSEEAGDISYDEETADATPAKNVYITDATEAPLASFQLDGETSQNGTPTPDAPVAVNTTTGEQAISINGTSYEVNLGKNLINFGSYQQSWDGAAVNGEGTTITMSPNTSGSMGLIYDSTSFSVSIPTGRTIVWSRTWAGGGTWQSGTFTFPLKLTYSDGTTETLSFGDTTENNYTQVLSASKTLAKPVVSVKIESGGCFGITNLSAPTSFNLQLEYGTATTYAPYFTPIELCKIGDYQDYIWNDNGTWKKHKALEKIVFDGSNDENWTRQPGNRADIEVSDAVRGSATNNPILSNSYKSAFVIADGNIFLSGLSSSIGIIDATNATTLENWRDYLSANNLKVYYALATPTDTEITNEALVAQLDNVASAPLYTGVNNITTITPNEQGTLEISYYTKYQPMVGSGGYVWEAGGAGGPTIIMNNSIDNVSPVWTIYGPTINPQLENATTGETIEYVGTIAQGQTLTIDMGEQTASLDGLNVISNLVGDFIQLAPGRNNMIYSVSGEAGASELGWSEIVG